MSDGTAGAVRRAAHRVFLCGDVMTGRGIDQILPYPCPPVLYEPYAHSALDYLALAESAHGPIPRPADFAYVWGAALVEWRRMAPDLRIVNLETSVTRSEAHLPKGINYRMSPENAECLRAAGIDCCVLANNHVLDWGAAGLRETLATLRRLGIAAVGAGGDRDEAARPAILETEGKGRVIVFALAATTSGTPIGWAAAQASGGVNVANALSGATVGDVAAGVAQHARPGDVVIVSIHWGPNWGYAIAPAERQFAHDLIDKAGVSIVHGHSSHHAKAIEVFKNRLILYGCGDFLNDYEGIQGEEEFRGDLSLMYFADIDPASGTLLGLEMTPLQIRGFRLAAAAPGDVAWLRTTLDRESTRFGAHIAATSAGRLTLV